MINGDALKCILTTNNEYVTCEKNSKVFFSNIPADFFASRSKYKNIVYYKDNFFNISDLYCTVGSDKYKLTFYKNINNCATPSHLDPLTKTLSRTFFEIIVINKSEKKEDFLLALIDLDNFKDINEKKGYLKGDKFLKCFASAIKSSVDKKDYVARFGGDEFLIAFSHKDIDLAKRQIDKLRKKLLDTSSYSYLSSAITFSSGLINYNFEKSYKENFNMLNTLLKSSKTNGKNKTTLPQSL